MTIFKSWLARYKNHYKAILALSLLTFITCFMHRGLYEMDIMEARNLVTAREMLEHHNWLVPTMNAELRLAKPPFLSIFTAWSVAFGMGIQDLANARLFSALCSWLTILGVYGLGFVMFGRKRLAFVSAVVFATLIQVGELAKNNAWNIPQHTFMLMAVIALVLALRNNAVKRNFALAGVFMGLSALIKGPVAFFAMLLPWGIAYFVAYKPQISAIRHWKIGLIVCIGIALVITAAWPLFIWAKHGAELKATMLTESKAWGGRHIEPWFFYFSFITWTGVWLVPFLSMFFVKKWTTRLIKKDYVFLLVWIVLTFVLLSVMPEKKMRYIYPIWIPIALLIGSGIEVWLSEKRQVFDRWVLRIHASVLTLLCVAVPVLLYVYLVAHHQMSWGALLSYTVLFLSLAIGLIDCVRRDLVVGVFGLTVTILCAFNLFFIPKALAISPTQHKYDDYVLLHTLPEYKHLPRFYASAQNEVLDMRMVWFSGQKILPLQALITQKEKPVESLLITDQNPSEIEALKNHSFTYSKIIFPTKKTTKNAWKIYRIIFNT